MCIRDSYNPKYKSIREKQFFQFFPLAMTLAVVAIYIRCVYRVVELAQGFRGYLILHEVYLMVLDALMIAITGIIFIPFHPVWAIGSKNVVRLAHIKKNVDEKGSDLEEQTDPDSYVEEEDFSAGNTNFPSTDETK